MPSMTGFRMDQEPRLHEKILFGVILFAIASVFFNIFWTPLDRKTTRARKEVKGLEGQVVAIEKLIQTTKEELAKRTPQQKVEVVKADQRVRQILERPAGEFGDEVNALVDALGSKSMGRRVKVGRISIGARAQANTYAMAPLTLDLHGPYTAVQAYLDGVEKMDRALVVRDLQMARQEGKGGELDVAMTLELYVPRR